MKKTIELNNEYIDYELIEQTPKFVLFNLEGREYAVSLDNKDDYRLNLSLNHLNTTVVAVDSHYVVDGMEFSILAPRKSRSKTKVVGLNQMTSPMPGKILKIFVSVGAEVVVGTPILVMEAMKMEHTIKAAKAGKIEKIHFNEGDQVAGGVELVKLC